MKKIYKRTSSKVIAGVASGIADYFLIDPVFVRLIFIFSLFMGGSGFVVYLVLMFVLPKDTELFGYAYPYGNNNKYTNPDNQNQTNNPNNFNANYQSTGTQNTNQYNTNESYRDYYNSFYAQNSNTIETDNSNKHIIFGLIFIILGILVFINKFVPFFTINIILPSLLMILGLFMIFGKKLKQK